eukprot:m.203651 g.203651  ORF g.203651 m.203651 type:complete len:66 (+) comp16876_c1_seq1:372-569(+)
MQRRLPSCLPQLLLKTSSSFKKNKKQDCILIHLHRPDLSCSWNFIASLFLIYQHINFFLIPTVLF